ncbi:uncharacterized protein AMSG_02601 [Thecamonas trahens ATCC 50062]|uniref:Uncharacterized protein n=1 Tax=Thecamonas trahens ATCC 50062 TaxID=461836 RepID=A0A0L0D5X2_THETB|nr:hypothetical protein AMSG_02601 [Thecamonas trahens ATCC 50062]KNC47575.1 hypothetical protein AMSG_02601 [Thecamonas trahens ATCC 50062]|eukprot:XP_013759507.1 hypothetical protein AMSG_02601 [Thecamonas trahens ATCC 50062]
MDTFMVQCASVPDGRSAEDVAALFELPLVGSQPLAHAVANRLAPPSRLVILAGEAAANSAAVAISMQREMHKSRSSLADESMPLLALPHDSPTPGKSSLSVFFADAPSRIGAAPLATSAVAEQGDAGRTLSDSLIATRGGHGASDATECLVLQSPPKHTEYVVTARVARVVVADARDFVLTLAPRLLPLDILLATSSDVTIVSRGTCIKTLAVGDGVAGRIRLDLSSLLDLGSILTRTDGLAGVSDVTIDVEAPPSTTRLELTPPDLHAALLREIGHTSSLVRLDVDDVLVEYSGFGSLPVTDPLHASDHTVASELIVRASHARFGATSARDGYYTVDELDALVVHAKHITRMSAHIFGRPPRATPSPPRARSRFT